VSASGTLNLIKPAASVSPHHRRRCWSRQHRTFSVATNTHTIAFKHNTKIPLSRFWHLNTFAKLTGYCSLQVASPLLEVTHLPHGITECYLPPSRRDIHAFTLSQLKLVLSLATLETCKTEVTWLTYMYTLYISYINTTVYYGIHSLRSCIPVDSGVTNLIHDRRSCVDLTLEVEANVARCVHSSVNKLDVKRNNGL